MGKLIELLNQFEKEKKSGYTWNNIDSYDNCLYGVDSDGDTEITMYSDLYSKYYGFIKWLVDNDKIEFDKCGLDIKDYLSYNKRYDKGIVMAENYDNDTFVVSEFYSPYEQLLMLLSIQDNPIEFLVSVLK